MISHLTSTTTAGPSDSAYRPSCSSRFTPLLAMGLLIASVCSTGCVTLASNLMYFVKGNDAPAEFAGLEEKRVAVIVSTSGGYNDDAPAYIMSRHINALLAANVKKIDLVNPEEVDRIVKDEPMSQENMSVVGKKLNADFVLLVDIQNLKLREGGTLYRGRCNSSVTVFKSSNGDRPVFGKQLPEFVYPEVGAPVTDFDEAAFQRIYLTVLASRIGRIFYPYDPGTDVALDASILGFDRMR